MRQWLWAALLALLPLPAWAQAYRCAIPQRIDRPQPDGPTDRQPRRVLPIGGYTLALSWSPGYCRANGGDRGAGFQCGAGNRFGFVLHGLWPDGRGDRWPQYCRSVPLLSERILRANLCTTPSVQLLQHEWAKHGSCMPGGPDAYFGRASRLYSRVRYPDMAALSRRRGLNAGQVAAEFARANRGLRADMVRVNVDRSGWLEEVWLCLGTDFRYRTCPPHQRLSPGRRVRIWRGS